MKWALIITDMVFVILFSLLDYIYKPYKEWDISVQKLWRVVLILIPMVALTWHIVETGITNTYSIITLSMLACALIGDMLIITNMISGLAAFLGCHIWNSINFLLLNHAFDKNIMIIGMGVYAFGLYIYSMLFLGKVKGLMGALVPVYLIVILCSTWRSYALFFSNEMLFALLSSVGTTLFFFTDAQVADEMLNNNLVMNDYRINHTFNNAFYYTSLLALTSSALIL
jgi:hypothetical protein